MPQSKGASPRPIAARSSMIFLTRECSVKFAGMVLRRSDRRLISCTGTVVSHLVGVGLLDVGRPVRGELAVVAGEHRVVEQLALVEMLAVLGDHLVGLLGLQGALGDQALGVELAGAGVLLDGAVHQRLRHHRLVLLVVAELAEADDVDHDVLLELLAEFDRQRGDQGHGLGIVAIDVEDRRLDHLEDVGAVKRGTVVARVGRGEADLVVDDQVYRAARAVAASLREVEHFLVNALAGHGGVAVDQHRQHLLLVGVAATDLAGIHRALDHRVDDLEVRGVERERQVHQGRQGSSRRSRSPCGTSRRRR